MTHEYTILFGGHVFARRETDGPPRELPATAVAWAAGTVLAVGSDAAVTGISRGDSTFVALRGCTVVPRPGGTLEPGAAADFEILDRRPGPDAGPPVELAVVRGGHVVAGRFEGLAGDG